MINKRQKMGCIKQNECANYGVECSKCFAMADIYNQHPCYADKDLVEVVRCKNCEHWHRSGYCKKLGMEHDRFERDFCSYGERRK